MNFNEYQQLAATTRSSRYGHGSQDERAVLALGLVGEAGEIAEHLKKHIGHGHPLDEVKIGKELGDVLWYVAEMAASFNFSLESIAIDNIDKLKARYPEGFSTERSIHRPAEPAAKPHPIPKDIVDPFAIQAEVMREAVHIDAEGRLVAPPENARKFGCPSCRQLVAVTSDEGFAKYHLHEKSKGSRCGYIGNT